MKHFSAKVTLSPKDVIERVRGHFMHTPELKIGAKFAWEMAKELAKEHSPGGAILAAGASVVEHGMEMLKRPSDEQIILDHTTGNTFRLRLGVPGQLTGQLFDAVVRPANGGGAVIVAKNSGLMLKTGHLQSTQNALAIVPFFVLSLVALVVVGMASNEMLNEWLTIILPLAVCLWLVYIIWMGRRLARRTELGLEQEEANFSVISTAMLALFKADMPASVVTAPD